MISCSATCSRCGETHTLELGEARTPALALMQRMEQSGRIDFDSKEPDPRFSTDYLYGPARGQMFGVLTYRDEQGNTGALKAFSGQYNSVWELDGWAPQLLDVETFFRLTKSEERTIKALGKQLEAMPPDSAQRLSLKRERKARSRALMRQVHGLYRLHNFRGERATLFEAALPGTGLPTGTGDCCAPKLLNLAARMDVTPTGLAEFYFGRDNRSGTRTHGQFYPSCKDKCGPILGWMLCGLQESHS